MFELCKNYFGYIVGFITITGIVTIVVIKYTIMSSSKENNYS